MKTLFSNQNNTVNCNAVTMSIVGSTVSCGSGSGFCGWSIPTNLSLRGVEN
jgi:hypothetical protein